MQALTDKEGLINAADAKTGGLVNDLLYLPDVIARLRKQAGTTTTPDDRNTFKQVALGTYIKDKVGKSPAANSKLASMMDNSPKVAIVYAEGDIVDGEGTATATSAATVLRANCGGCARTAASRRSSCALTAPGAARRPARSSSGNWSWRARRASR